MDFYVNDAKWYRDIIELLGFNQIQAARFLRVDERTSRRYALGESRVPFARRQMLEAEQKKQMKGRRGR